MSRRLLVALTALLLALPADAANRYVAATGDWDDVGTWNDDGCGQAADASVAPTAADAVILCPGVLVSVPCNVDIAFTSLTDAAGDWSVGGGYSADHSACPAGEVGQAVIDNASLSDNTTSIVLDDMRAPAVFIAKGRQVYSDEQLGLIEFTPAAGCAAAGSCWEVKWPVTSPTWPIAAPASAATALAPTTYTSFGVADSYRYIRMLDGQHKGDVFIVESATTSGGNPVMRITPGALDDYYGAGSGFTPSLKMARDSALDATPWTTTSPRRKLANITTGTLAGNYYHNGQCLVVDPQTRYAANRPTNYYRIAAAIDGGGGVDQLLLDPWMEIAAEDTTGAVDADIVPCLKPGDRFEAWEPFTFRPATAGSDASYMFFTGFTPELVGVYLPNASPGYSTLTSTPTAAINFQSSPAGSSVAGPVAQIGLRNTDGDGNPQVISVYDSSGLTLRKFTGSGYYRPTPVLSDNVWHFLQFWDAQGLVLDDWSASWGNNECSWNPASVATGSAKPDQITMMNGNCHQVFAISGEVHPILDPTGDTDRGISCNHAAGYEAYVDCKVVNNMVWTVGSVGITLSGVEGDQSSATVRDNVIAYPIPFRLITTTSASGISIGRDGPGNWSTSAVVNNVILTNRQYGTGATRGIEDAYLAAYNYIGENQAATWHSNTLNVDTSYYGNLIEAAGSSTTMQYGLNFMGTGVSGTFTIRDMVVRRLCNPATRRVGIYDDGTTTQLPASGAIYDWQHLTFGLWCPEYAGNAEGASTQSSGAVRFGGGSGETINLTGSTLSNWLIVNGDHGPDGTPADEWATYGVVFGPATGCSTSCVFDRLLCSTNRQGTTTGTAGTCLRNPGAGYSVTRVRQLDTYPEALGIRDEDDLRLRRESLASGDSDEVIGARYAGIIAYTSAMDDFDIPQEWLIHRSRADFEPDLTVLPASVRGYYATGGGGRRVLPEPY